MQKPSFELTIALRYLRTRRHGFFALVTTLIAIGGVTLGVAALIVTLAVMSGFRSDIQEKTLGIQPHIVLLGAEKDSELEIESTSAKVKALEKVEAVAPFILGQTLVKAARGSQGVLLRGIDPDKEFAVTAAKKTLVAGSWDALAAPDKRPVILGKELARNLTISLGDEVLLFSTSETAALGAMGSVPKVEKFTVEGIFQSGMYEFDANMAFTSLPAAQKLFGLQGPTGLGVRTADLDQAEKISLNVTQATGGKYWVRSWLAMNRNLFEALKLEKVVMTIILTMIILVAAFTIISNLILMSIEKAKDIGILRALGASQRSIRKIFLYAGMFLGTTGIALGTGLGIALVQILKKTQWIKLPQDVYYIDTLPVKLSGMDIALVLVSAFAITVISAVYPAVQAAKVNPVEAIRYG